jgi:hypothetical protein
MLLPVSTVSNIFLEDLEHFEHLNIWKKCIRLTDQLTNDRLL